MRLKTAIAALLLILVSAGPARAQLRIDITGARTAPMPIAIPSFAGGTAEEARIGREITMVIRNNLANSGLFRNLDEAAFIQSMRNVDVRPNFNDWKAIAAQALAHGEVTQDPATNGLRVSYRLWDVFAETNLDSKAMTGGADAWRNIAHIISDRIYERITGETGYFNTRIVYIAETGPATRLVKRLAIMDQDGANQKMLTDGSYLVLTPRFSPNMQQVIYLSYINNNPRVFLLDLATGNQQALGNFPGMTFAPRFSHDGRRVVFSMERNGNTNIYDMDIASREVRRITNRPGIDTSPSFSPDGRQIVFNSDRSGRQQLYVMNSDGGNVRRISWGEGRYATPVWSPRGDYIAFTKMLRGQFYIGIMHPDGSGERLISRGFFVEAPSWSPNGRLVIFYKKDRMQGMHQRTRLYTVDITGYNEREIPTTTNASDPAWSPLLQ
ncbi:MAG: Tol-Pal system beta propeller repeat protein TolB [Alphaproteobacteria bacterium]|nr:Tol-Pal system beta propeller repeat protein TolB [Alphaproteobacteria bacterium]